MQETGMSLEEAAVAIVAASDLRLKTALANKTAKAWFARTLSLTAGVKPALPQRPGRPEKPELLAPRAMPKRSITGEKGRLALVHSLAHIELNAIDLAWDLVARCARLPMPRAFFDNWVQVGLEETKHFSLLADRLIEMGSFYGALPAHDGLWQAAEETGHNLIARLAIIPLVLEARGLDITPPMLDRIREQNDEKTAAILEIIYRDEKRHVAFGTKWFLFACARHGLKPEPTFHAMVRRHFRGSLRPPFNDKARSQAGLTPGFYKPLAGLTAVH
ncbi:MAG: ferritin-like domain-containing protein [Rhizobiales bacterium]|nr:ferritin-like domain-containing protein [Hyphomicrobiales bacterium]